MVQINLSTHPSGPSPKPCGPNQPINSSIQSISQTLWSKSTYQLIHPVHLPNPVVQINTSIRSISQTLWSKSTYQLIHPVHLPNPVVQINLSTHPSGPSPKPCGPNQPINSSIRSISQTLWSKSTYQLIHPVHLPNPVVQINTSIRSISQTLWSKSTYQLIHPVHLPNPVVQINTSIRSISQTLWSKSTYQLIHPVHLPNPVVQINSSIRSISQTLWSKSTYQLIHPVHLPNPVVQINLSTHPSGPSPKPCGPNQPINSSIRSISQTLWSKSTYQLIHPVHLPNPVVQINLVTHPFHQIHFTNPTAPIHLIYDSSLESNPPHKSPSPNQNPIPPHPPPIPPPLSSHVPRNSSGTSPRSISSCFFFSTMALTLACRSRKCSTCKSVLILARTTRAMASSKSSGRYDLYKWKRLPVSISI